MYKSIPSSTLIVTGIVEDFIKFYFLKNIQQLKTSKKMGILNNHITVVYDESYIAKNISDFLLLENNSF